MNDKTVVMSLRGLNRTYKVAEGADLEVLKEVDLDLYAGEVVGLGGLDGQGLPLGLQLIGRAFDEETLFRVGGVIESSANFTAKPAGY